MALANHLGKRLHKLSVVGQAGSMPEHKYAYVIHENTSVTSI
jgi:hypothetical protein